MIPTLALAAFVSASPGPPTQIDLARAYLAFERAVRQHPPTGEDLARVNRAADGVAWRFLSGQVIDAVRELNEIRLELESGGEVTDAQRLAASIHAIAPDWIVGLEPAPEIVYESMYPIPMGPPADLRVAINVSRWSDVAASIRQPITPLRIDARSGTIEPASIPLDARYAASFEFRVMAGDADEVVGACTVWPERPEAIADAALQKAGAAPAVLALSIELFRRRLSVLTDGQRAVDRWLLGPSALLRSIELEASALARGDDPYLDHRGDIWHEFIVSGVSIPCRVYAPESLRAPAPVVFAFHGAGGNEHLFMDGYGAGLLRELADTHGFIAVSPSTYALIGAPGLLPGLLDEIDRLYDVDRGRVSAIGHSLGAMLVSGLAWQQRKVLSAVCAIAGGRPPRPGTPMAPLLIVGAELDRIIPAEPLRIAAERAAANGLPVTYREAKDIGHVLVVAATLEACVEWVLGAGDRSPGTRDAQEAR
ncbi:MAG: hypothetical protein H6811_09010 [Phycisphaeraceae bacterium]|nr:hypothetical protein [Phycisphaeraceae bacterium]